VAGLVVRKRGERQPAREHIAAPPQVRSFQVSPVPDHSCGSDPAIATRARGERHDNAPLTFSPDEKEKAPSPQ